MFVRKHFNLIVICGIVISLIICFIFINSSAFGIEKYTKELGYESKLFNQDEVHNINIIIDNWDSFIETCENEEYTICDIQIDNDVVKNVGIRAKGNTSLSSVKQMNSERYSFKLEFDQYDSTNNYFGLDKLCLNNIIQDNTYMKDYLTYTLMDEFGVDSPLCSFAYITVNGEDWGLYLAVEAIEDSFLERNYGAQYGDLYKPDSMSMGGGRGQGKNFDMDNFMSSNTDLFNSIFGTDTDFSDVTPEKIEEFITESGLKDQFDFPDMSNFDPNNMPDMNNSGTIKPASFNENESNNQPPDMNNNDVNMGNFNPNDGNIPEMPGDGNMPDMGNFNPNDGNMPEMPGDGNMPDMGNFNPNDGNMPNNMNLTPPTDGNAPDDTGFNTVSEMSSSTDSSTEHKSSRSKGDFGNFGGFGSNQVTLLQYIDDEISSYDEIFDSAKTDVTNKDKTRLINALKELGEGNVEESLDVEEVMRYLVVHNFVVNGDSYTGSMIHNYYLYEDDGKLSMIPWDYNLAFGGFMGNQATSSVNDPIDSPLNVSGDGTRPMADWVINNSEYNKMYHEYFEDFINSFDIQKIIDDTYELIAPYVEKDPTKFCTYDEFTTAVDALKTYCNLRVQSIKGQLDGTIPSTDEGQSADSSTLIDASGLNISDMGSMGNMGGGGGNMGGGKQNMPGSRVSSNTDFKPQKPNK